MIGLSRRRPDFITSAGWITADLTQPDAVAQALTAASGATHLVYAAVHEEADLVDGWTDEGQIATNLAMLQTLLTSLEGRAAGLRHVTLLQGTKAYGIHHGPFPIPARESDPPFIAPNFYDDQQDWLRERATGAAWSFTILRPQLVCGFALGNPMNAVAAIGVYGAICRELGHPSASPAANPASRRRSMPTSSHGPSPGPARSRAARGRPTTSRTATSSAGRSCGRAWPVCSAPHRAPRTRTPSPA